MRITRIFTDQPLSVGKEITLTGSAANHLVNVLRLKPGASVILFNDDGTQAQGTESEYRATLTASNKRQATLQIDSFEKVQRESPLRLHLLQGLSKGDRMDFAIQKSVELGVARITPIICERTVVKLDQKRQQKKQDHFTGVSIAASEQSGRCQLTPVAPLMPMAQAMRVEAEVKLILDPRADLSVDGLKQQVKRPKGEVALLIGPEGGLSDSEITLARDNGFQAITLGPRILRTETAALTTISLLQLIWGDL